MNILRNNTKSLKKSTIKLLKKELKKVHMGKLKKRWLIANKLFKT